MFNLVADHKTNKKKNTDIFNKYLKYRETKKKKRSLFQVPEIFKNTVCLGNKHFIGIMKRQCCSKIQDFQIAEKIRDKHKGKTQAKKKKSHNKHL